jgi:2-polyprenyl-3-methyl-5-hydroxy-6-metoxy-1,4-benzoquinol methylase
MRKMMHFRVLICPFESLITHVPAGAAVLDVGCGAGLFLALLAATVPEINGVGFDSSAVAIEAGKRMVEAAADLYPTARLELMRLDVSTPWPSGSYDVVSLVDVLHHIPPAAQKSVFRMAVEKVKPGGALLYKDMAQKPFFPAAMNRLHDLVLARQWIHYVPIGEVEEWASESHLTMTHSAAFSRLWYRHDLRIFSKPAT